MRDRDARVPGVPEAGDTGGDGRGRDKELIRRQLEARRRRNVKDTAFPHVPGVTFFSRNPAGRVSV